MPTPPIALASLSIQNFRGIESLELDFHGPDGDPNQIVVLAGPNGCGKTAVLEAALLAANGSRGSKLVTGPSGHGAIRRGSDRYSVRASLLVHGQENENVVGIPVPEPFRMNEQQPVWYFSSWRVPNLVGSVDPTVGKRGRRPAKNDQNGLLNVKQLLVNVATIDRFENTQPPFGRYYPLMRTINEAWSAFYPDRKESFSVEVVKSPELSGGSFEVYLRTTQGYLLEVDLLSAGQLELFLFLSALALNGEREGIVFIDEPELHLDPQWHRLILRSLIKLQRKAQFVVATHSPEIYDAARSYERHFLVPEDDPRAGIWHSVKSVEAGA